MADTATPDGITPESTTPEATSAGDTTGRPPPPDRGGLNPSDRAFWVGLVVVILSMVAAAATYAILTGLTPIPPRGDVVFLTLLSNGVLILAMFAVIAWQSAGLVQGWRAKVPGARLQVRVVVLFSLIAVLPAVLLALAAANTFSRSLDGWFSKQTREIIDNSTEVAQAYIDVHGQLVITDILNMARDIDAEAARGPAEPQSLKNLLIAQTSLRGLPVGFIIDAEGRPVISAYDTDRVAFARPPADAIRRAEQGEVPLLDSSATSRVYAVAKLAQLPGRYLYVSRELTPAVVAQIRRTQQNTVEYERLRDVSRNLKIAHNLLYFMIASTALLAAIWAGLWFATRFVSPIRRLIEGAERVSLGDLDVVLPEKRGEGDLRRFSATFNRMTREIKHQRDALVAFNHEVESRRRFTEAVLSGVSAGVIGLDSAGLVTLVSPSAERLLAMPADQLIGRPFAEVLPEFAGVLATTGDGPGKLRAAREVTRLVGTNERTFAAEVTREQAGAATVGSVVTFDDVTDLVVAQRTAAWADVARRIAHEIKNPLTPIQLSAERIRRKYGPQIVADKETFDKLTDAISRQVDVIKSMVDEFASFARLPQPTMEPGDLRDIVHGPVVLFRESHPGLVFDLKVPDAPVLATADRRLLTQAVTNLVKNAAEAIEALSMSQERPDNWQGRIEVLLLHEADRAVVEVIDNGIGLPKQNRAKLLEPYVTTRAKGTGLGLAIVQKIVEQHRGTLTLGDAPVGPGRTRGARIRVTLPLPTPGSDPASPPSWAAAGDDAAAESNLPTLATSAVTAATPPVTTPPMTNPVVAPATSATLRRNSDRVMPIPRPEPRVRGAS